MKEQVSQTKKGSVLRASMYVAVLIGLAAFLIFSILAAITFGNADLSLKDVYSVIAYKLFHIKSLSAYAEGAVHDVVWLIRLPRVLLALAVGMALSVCGVVMQAIVQNPLADPYVLGISSGASLGATLAIMLGVGGFLGGNSVGVTAFIGAMVTSFAVISDHKAKAKYPIVDYEVTPDIAVLDEEITATMPPKLVSYTGLDALCHAIEAYVAKKRSNFTNPLAIHAITIIFGYLEDSYDGNLAARGEMHIAQCMAGMAFANAELGITHSLAHAMGGAFGIPHGLCNAILMPYVIKYNCRNRAAMRHYANIGRRLGLEGMREMNLVNSLIRSINDVEDYMNIPKTFYDAGISEFRFITEKESIAMNALNDNCTPSNPREVTKEDLLHILECAFYGKPDSIKNTAIL